MLVKSEITSLVVVAALHLIKGAIHHHARVVAGVQNSPLQLLLVLLVVIIAPWAAIYLAWTRTLKLGAALFSFSMAASLAFGLTIAFRDRWPGPSPERRSGARSRVPVLRIGARGS